MKKNQINFKIILAITFAYFLSSVAIKKVFLANSPKIKPNLPKILVLEIQDFLRINSNKFISLFKKSEDTEKKLKDIQLKMITKGVYGKSNDEASITYIKLNEVEWVEYTFNIKGKEIKIKVPKGQPQPSQQMLEEIYK